MQLWGGPHGNVSEIIVEVVESSVSTNGCIRHRRGYPVVKGTAIGASFFFSLKKSMNPKLVSKNAVLSLDAMFCNPNE